MDLSTRLAVYRTRLAEKRTAISELQLGILLVTLPLTAHLSLMLLAERHPVAAKLLELFPLLVAIFFMGIAIVAHSTWKLVRMEQIIRALRRDLQAAIASQDAPGRPGSVPADQADN